MKNPLISLLAIAFSLSTLAAVTTREEPGVWELRTELSKPILGPDGKQLTYLTSKECTDAAKAEFLKTGVPLAKYRCVTATKIAVEGTCDPAPPPAETDEVFEPNGSKYDLPELPQPGVRLAPEGTYYTFTHQGNYEGHLCPSGISYWFTQIEPVLRPFPACWVNEPVAKTSCP